jgi:hypothetical protein
MPKEAAPIGDHDDASKPSGATVKDGKTGLLKTTYAPDGRRVFVDGRVVGQTPLAARVPCGRHTVRIGSTGGTLTVDVPCGGERLVRFEEGHIGTD